MRPKVTVGESGQGVAGVAQRERQHGRVSFLVIGGWWLVQACETKGNGCEGREGIAGVAEGELQHGRVSFL